MHLREGLSVPHALHGSGVAGAFPGQREAIYLYQGCPGLPCNSSLSSLDLSASGAGTCLISAAQLQSRPVPFEDTYNPGKDKDKLLCGDGMGFPSLLSFPKALVTKCISLSLQACKTKAAWHGQHGNEAECQSHSPMWSARHWSGSFH